MTSKVDASFLYLSDLWCEGEIAENAVRTLYQADNAYHPKVGTMFLTGLRARIPRIPSELTLQLQEVSVEVSHVAITLMGTHVVENIEALLDCALQPLPHLKQPIGVETLCSGIFFLNNHLWYTSLPKPLRNKLHHTYCTLLVNMPPDSLDIFWNLIENDDPLWNYPLLQTMDEICNLHSLNHLLYGLQYCKTDYMRNSLILALEKVGDPSCLEPLKTLERQSAITDWPVARLIARAIRTIQRQYNLFDGKDLLLPVNYSSSSPNLLLPM